MSSFAHTTGACTIFALPCGIALPKSGNAPMNKNAKVLTAMRSYAHTTGVHTIFPPSGHVTITKGREKARIDELI
jgi:hypothetical protein